MTRKEKFAEIERRVNAVLAGPICHYSVTVLANYMLAELEAAGQKWDPEGLAEMQLYAFEGPGGYRISREDTAAMYPFSHAQADEVIRRYEALPEIQEAFHRWQDEDYGNFRADENFAETLGRLLHGKDGGS